MEEDYESLINRGLSLNIRAINTFLAQLFQKYSIILDKIVGNELMGNSQIHQIYSDQDGVFREYSKGQIVFKNGIDKLKYILDHRERVGKLIGVPSGKIYDNRRDLAKVKEYVSRLQNVCEIGDIQDPIQMYISKHDANTGGLDSSADWVNYVLTQSWIDKLAAKSIGGEYSPYDYRIEYLADLVDGLVSDHVIDYHEFLAEFVPSDFLSKGVVDGKIKYKVEDAMNRLNSFGKLEYGFYELFKPIGGGEGKHVKVKVSTDGYVDVSGVVALSDCIHWEWEYGSEEYLRSLNTGNQRYLLQLDQPFNDEEDEKDPDKPRSTLWWRPDGTTPPEKIEINPSKDDTDQPTAWYYRPYETERFLRWFGNDHIPAIDETTLEKCTVCSSPSLSNDTQAGNFHTDARNIGEMDMDLTRTNIDASTSQSLLSLYPSATIALRTYVRDGDGFRTPVTEPEEGEVADAPGDIHQYLEFVVTGNRQTYNVSFDVRGRMKGGIQEPHHFLNTLGGLENEWHELFNTVLFLKTSAVISPEITTLWDSLKPGINCGESWVSETLEYLEGRFSELLGGTTVVDALRLRQIDMDTIVENNKFERGIRIAGIHDQKLNLDVNGFLLALSDDGQDVNPESEDKRREYIFNNCKGDDKRKETLYKLIRSKKFLDPKRFDGSEETAKTDYGTFMLQALYDYIFNFKDASSDEELAEYQANIRLTEDQFQNLVKSQLEKIYGKKSTAREAQSTKMKFSFNGNWSSYNIVGAFTADSFPKDSDMKPRMPYAIEFGTDVSEIDGGALTSCKSLVDVVVPKSVATIGENAFKNCAAIQNVQFKGRNIAEIKSMANFPWGVDEWTHVFNKGDFSDVTVDMLRDRITTFNNLVVRLPVDTEHNCIASRRIFLDWKKFVSGAANHLRDCGLMSFQPCEGLGSDMELHDFDEYLVDGEPLVDYSWLYDSTPTSPKLDGNGKPIGDRWDYWDEEDFNWPQ